MVGIIEKVCVATRVAVDAPLLTFALMDCQFAECLVTYILISIYSGNNLFIGMW